MENGWCLHEEGLTQSAELYDTVTIGIRDIREPVESAPISIR